ncbi:acetate kinase [Altererythrobacter atlanticus]|uniref:Acetate kinase n=1 Tax=Croceibacterium atlanticum TaxID=1267766 RepID=A0A0F7KWA4_9SPHN|nr:acetate/propionate family kinase [Croceibacterium atlanticum]AKH43431.1 Acetate kinase [Croceibacterium atlanticum]MBB5731861.1 acetate kinase [Croceibacterium atlanticum]
MSKAIICINSGSSSIKFGLFTLAEDGPRHAAGGKLEGIGTDPRLLIRDDEGNVLEQRHWENGAHLGHEELLRAIFAWSDNHLDEYDIVAAGHRVVHGGREFWQPLPIDAHVLAELESFCSLAPLHQPHNLAAIREIARHSPGMLQVACFDTAFHHAMPAVASAMALPRELSQRGFRRYGFHGLSYEYIARQLRHLDPELAQGKVIAAHLGNGASMCAMDGGRSVDTTMGFTALDGLMMGTRTGSLDPGVVIHLQLQEGLTAQQVETLLYKQSGLLGVSGISSDMRALHDSADPRAREAIDLFVWRAARHAAALMSALQGLDGMVFTAGIGENDPLIRKAICERLGWAGLLLDEEANQANAPVISAPHSRVKLRVIATDEERMIALHTHSVYQAQRSVA